MWVLLHLIFGVTASRRLQSQFSGSDGYVVGQAPMVTSTCSASFNSPCAIQKVHLIVQDLVTILNASSAVGALGTLEQITSGGFNSDWNFWPEVYDASGVILASGRPASAEASSGRELVRCRKTLRPVLLDLCGVS